MADGRRQQEVAFDRVKHLDPGKIRCRFCGESSASRGSWVGFAHLWGPHGGHRFIAARPVEDE